MNIVHFRERDKEGEGEIKRGGVREKRDREGRERERQRRE